MARREHNFAQESTVRQRLEEIIPPESYVKSPQVLFNLETMPKIRDQMRALPKDEQLMFKIRELQRRWAELTEEQRAPYFERSKELTEQQTQVRQMRPAIKQRFYEEIGVVTAATQQQEETPVSFRYPDHEFAIEESQLYFNFTLSNFMFLDNIPRCMAATIQESNLPPNAVMPHFVDDSWVGWDEVLYKCRARAGGAQPSDEDREQFYVRTGYYKVYPPNDEFLDDEDEDEGDDYGTRSIPFSRKSFQRYLQLVKKDLQGVQWTALSRAAPKTIYRNDFDRHEAEMYSLVSDRGDRIEYLYEKYDHFSEVSDTSLLILNTAAGRLVIAGMDGCHPYVFTNLLEFFNSDGSDTMRRLLPDNDKLASVMSDQEIAKVLADAAMRLAEEYLYDQQH